MNDPVFMSSPDVSEIEELFMVRALRSGWVAPLGPDVDAFEKEVAERVGVSEAVALSSGTAALHLALLSLGVGPGDVVVTSTMTFAATANAIVYVGARPVFIDCDIESGNMDASLLREGLTVLLARGERVAAIIPVDLFGKVANYTQILKIADERGIPVVCDAAEAFGASHCGQPAGSFGRASVLSFNGNKIMTTSGGGMLLSNDRELADRSRYLATQARQRAVHYEHTEIGYNYRLSNLLAALGRAQLSRLDEMITKRRAVRERYRELFGTTCGVEIFGGASDQDDNCWLTSIVVDHDQTGWAAADLAAHLKTLNIESRPLWKPMHLQPVFRENEAFLNGNSERLFNTGITLPSGSALSKEQLRWVADAISQFVTGR